MRVFLSCLVAAAFCWAGMKLLRGRGADVVAEVEGVPVTRLELQEALRAHLWVRNESWQALGAEARRQARQAALENLVNDRLIRVWRLREGGEDREVEARRESALMRRQFTGTADYEQRLAGQQRTQRVFDEAVRDAQLDEAWIAGKVTKAGTGAARAWYDQHKETLRIPEAHHAFHIFLTRHDAAKPDREGDIRKIHRQLVAKEKTFATLAKEHSEDDRTKTLGGDLGWFTRQRMPADFVSAVEKLRVGELSGPVPTALGWHLILVMERRPSRLPTFEEAEPEIASLLAGQQHAAALKALLADLHHRSSARIVHHHAVIEQAKPAP
ncbi:MAG: peptidylprolyl isomerase [Prosthecobacter sp.]